MPEFPEQLGIWRRGSVLHASSSYCVTRAQPVDASGSPRWDYVIKLALGQDGTHGQHTTRAHDPRAGLARSIKLGTMVRHPNVVPILDGDVAAADCYVVMPMLGGRSMRWHLEQGPRKPLPVALWLVRQVCQGLEAIHAAGWTHGDIKPDNVIVSENGHATLIDLAFAQQGTQPANHPFHGTPQYAAPEMLLNPSSASSASDVFAAGRMLWEWLARVQTSNECALSPVCEWVERMVDETPSKRPTAGAVAQALLRLEIDTLGEHIGPAAPRRVA